LTFYEVYSLVQYNRIESIINISRTLFVSIVLTISTTYFIKDANRLILNPIDRMLKKVRFIAKNPMAAANDDVERHALGVTALIHKEEE
jgi:hypothetical protein